MERLSSIGMELIWKSDLGCIFWGPSRLFLAHSCPSLIHMHIHTHVSSMTRMFLAVGVTGYSKIVALTTKYSCLGLVLDEMSSPQSAEPQRLYFWLPLILQLTMPSLGTYSICPSSHFPQVPAKGSGPKFPQAFTWSFVLLILPCRLLSLVKE